MFLQGSFGEGANTFLGQVKALMDAKADKQDVSVIDEVRKFIT